jgi:hypothetical protein
MSRYLRFSREEYEAIARAHRLLPPAGSYRAWRSWLTNALREGRPELAERVAGFNDRQVALLRGHLEGPGPSAGEDVLAARRLTWREWQEVARAGAAFCLMEGGQGGFRGFLLRQVGASSALGRKLARLDDAQLVRLYLGVRSGRRCCP